VSAAAARAAARPLPCAGGSPFAGLDVCGAAGMRLRPAACGPVFEQRVWDFSGVAGLPAYAQPGSWRWDFSVIINPLWRIVAREYLLALLAPGHPAVRVLPSAHRVPRTVQTCTIKLAELTRWLNWLTRRGVTALGEVTDYHCAAFVAERSERRDDDGALIAVRQNLAQEAAMAVLALADYRELFSTDSYAPHLRPFNGRRASAVAGLKYGGHNTTPVVPAGTFTPMLAAALYTAGVLGPHILRLLQQPPARRAAASMLPLPGKRAIADLARCLSEHIDQSRPLPRCPGRVITQQKTRQAAAAGFPAGDTRVLTEDPVLAVSLHHLAIEAGYSRFPYSQLEMLRPAVERAIDVAGIEEPWGRDAESVTRADGNGTVAWTGPLSGRQTYVLGGYLRSACLIVIAAVTGMRNSELAELTVGCRLPPQEISPGLTRHRLASTLVKGQPLGGSHDEWVVTTEVSQAIGIAEQLLGDPPGSPLFGRLHFGVAYPAFRAWVNSPAGQRLGLAPIPGTLVTLRMLRRTLAVELAYRPGGLLATKIHLKHLSVMAAEGYAARPGGAQARFLAEVGEEEHRRNLDLMLAAYRSYQQGIRPSGPGARNLTELFTTIDTGLASSAPACKTAGSDQEIRNLLTRRAGALHLGVANYCWFTDPDQALCLKLAGPPAAAGPLAGLCDSARCPQATHHPCHRPVWADTVTSTQALINGLSRSQKTEHARLTADLARAQRVLAGMDAAADASAGGTTSGTGD